MEMTATREEVCTHSSLEAGASRDAPGLGRRWWGWGRKTGERLDGEGADETGPAGLELASWNHFTVVPLGLG